jgi:hypothetical protein
MSDNFQLINLIGFYGKHNWTEEQPKEGVENSCSYWHSKRVVDEGKEQILTDIPHRCPAQLPGTDNCKAIRCSHSERRRPHH